MSEDIETNFAGPAPADAVARPSWPRWKKIVAYAALAALASASIWVIDLKVGPQATPQAMPRAR